MRAVILTISMLVIAINMAQSQPLGYYQLAEQSSGWQLKARLQQIISQQTVSWSYSDLPSFFSLTDRDLYYEQDSSLLDIYSENADGPDAYNYWYSNNSLVSGASSEGEGWNREHIYAQSFFNGSYPMYSDLHFVLPTDARVNQAKSNFPFGKVGNAPTFVSLNGSKRGPANMPGYSYTVFEPIDEFKGDIARMLMYVAVRYEKLIPYFDFQNIRNPLDSLSEKAFKDWYIPLLLQWHHQDPVSQKEIDRNNQVYALQGNRNPFIDHPEFAAMIWSSTYSDTTVPEAPYFVSVLAKGARFIKLTWPPGAQYNLLGYEVYVNDELAGRTADTTFTLHHLQANTTYNIKVRSYSNSYAFSTFSHLDAVQTLAEDDFFEDLYLSKLIVGTDNNKAIELHNNTGYDVFLGDYYINIRQENQLSGALYWSSNKIQLEGVLPHGQRLVILNPNAQLSCGFTAANVIYSNAPQLQLDGTMALSLNYKNRTIDIAGNPAIMADYAQNKSLYRKADAAVPASIFDSSAWDNYPADYCDGLGSHNPVSIATPKEPGTWQLFPNPSIMGSVTVNGRGLESVKYLKIIDLHGKTLLELQQPFKNGNRFNLPEGISGWVVVLLDGKALPLLIL